MTLIKLGIFLSISTAAYAQATRTWVSGVGDDVNPCSRTAPCKTFAGAISKTAANGEINCIDSGGFGSVTIIKSITIDCHDVIGGVLAAGTAGIIINGPGINVNLRGLDLNGAGTGTSGVRVLTAAMVGIEDSKIYGFKQNGVSLETPEGTRAAIFLSGTTLSNNSVTGIGGSPKGQVEVTVARSDIFGSGTGLSAEANVIIRISKNTITANKIGLTTTGSGKVISFKDNVIDGNEKNGVPTSATPLM
jgi:hypothetical protein